jgi:RNA polymerase sigma-70 factor (ECF subfamily)
MERVSRLSGWLAGAAAAAGRAGFGAPAGDWALWRAACAGDAASATRLVHDMTPQAYGLAIQMLGRREDAQDAVQDAFMRLWRSRPSDSHGARLATYFNTIVLNCCRTQLTRRREQATEQEALTELHDAWQLRDAAADPEPPGPDGPARQQRLQRGLQRLPARQRMAIAMWTYADASVPEIARALDIDPNAAHQLLHRAKLALRAHLEGGSP